MRRKVEAVQSYRTDSAELETPVTPLTGFLLTILDINSCRRQRRCLSVEEVRSQNYGFPAVPGGKFLWENLLDGRLVLFD